MKHLAALLLALLLSACATPQNQEAAAFRAWVAQTKPQAESGQMKFTDFYTQAHDRLQAIPDNGPQKLAIQRGYAEMIPVARAYEGGAMTREQFDDVRRITNVAMQQQSAQMEAQRQQAIANAMAQAAENMRRNQPTHTSCNRIGTMVNCTTR